LVQDRHQWQAFFITVMNLWFLVTLSYSSSHINCTVLPNQYISCVTVWKFVIILLID
jgi:hypothetical protein